MCSELPGPWGMHFIRWVSTISHSIWMRLFLWRWLCVKSLSHAQLFTTPWTVVCQAPLSMEFSRQDYWSGLSCPPPWDLPDPGVKLASLMSPALAGSSLPLVSPRKPGSSGYSMLNVWRNYQTISKVASWVYIPTTLFTNNGVLVGGVGFSFFTSLSTLFWL